MRYSAQVHHQVQVCLYIRSVCADAIMGRVLLMLFLFVVPAWNVTNMPVPTVQYVSVVARLESELTLEWYNDNSIYSFILTVSNGIQHQIPNPNPVGAVTHTVSSLYPGTEYTITLYTVCEGMTSNGYTFSAVTTPMNVAWLNVHEEDTYIELWWSKVNYDPKYDYVLKYEKTDHFIPGYYWHYYFTHIVSSLSPLTQYTFTLYTEFKDVRSRGYNFSAVTAPSNVDYVSVTVHTESEVTLEWNKVNNSNTYAYILSYEHRRDYMTFIARSNNDSVVKQTVSSLSPGMIYHFTIYTVYKRRLSKGYTLTTTTAPLNVDKVMVAHQSDTSVVLWWSNKNDYYYKNEYVLKYGNKEAFILIPDYHWHDSVTHTVSSLSPGTKYTFTLYTVFEGLMSRGYSFTVETTPSSVTGLRCEYSWLSRALGVVWDSSYGIQFEYEVQVNGEIQKYINKSRLQLDYLPSTELYDITVTSLSGDMRSNPVSTRCTANPIGFITESVLAIVCIMLLSVCIGVVWKCRISCHRRKLGNADNKETDQASVNMSTLKMQENQNLECLESQFKDVKYEENNPYEVPDMTTRVSI